MEENTDTTGTQLINKPYSKAKGARRMENLLGYVSSEGAMSSFISKPKKILEQGFILYYKDTSSRETSAVFLPNETDAAKWDVYKNENHGYAKSGEMPRIKASNLDILRLASGGEALGKVFYSDPVAESRGITR